MQSHQCLPKPPHLSWEESAAYMLEAATAYRMLASWQPHIVQPGDAVLVWGGSGGLGSMAIQITKALGGVPIAVVSNDERGEYCKQSRRHRLHQPQEVRPLGPPARLDR